MSQGSSRHSQQSPSAIESFLVDSHSEQVPKDRLSLLPLMKGRHERGGYERTLMHDFALATPLLNQKRFQLFRQCLKIEVEHPGQVHLFSLLLSNHHPAFDEASEQEDGRKA